MMVGFSVFEKGSEDLSERECLGLDSVKSCYCDEEAAGTCILSREWRYRWIKIPKLVFIQDVLQVSTDGAEFSIFEQTLSFDAQLFKRESIRMFKRRKLFYAINQVLSMHEGTIQEFTLSMELDVHCDEIDHIFSQFGKKKYRQEIKISYPSLFCTVRPQGASFY
ncbi:hypothetical protein Tco_0073358 [Tanacetum coccineum]